MPWIRDGSLRDLLVREGRLPLATTLPLVSAIAAALDHAHGEQVLPLRREAGERAARRAVTPTSMDFGIARKLHSESREWIGSGRSSISPPAPQAYVSPEQANGEVDLDAALDVYSLACMVYEHVGGTNAIPGQHDTEIVTRRFRAPAA
jgi:hypothetical protein